MNAIDTNILVYAFDSAYPSKRKICQEILSRIFEGKERAVVTNQILAEFAVTVMEKIEKPLSQPETTAIVGAILTSANWKILNYTGSTILHAITSQQPFWDAVIAQTLKEHNINVILTENTKDFAKSGITTVNPLTEVKT